MLQHVPLAADDVRDGSRGYYGSRGDADDAAGQRAGGTRDATRYADDVRLGSRDADDAGVVGGGAARDAGDAGGGGGCLSPQS